MQSLIPLIYNKIHAMKTIVIFASGSGTNAENIITKIHGNRVHVARIYCNNPKAGVIERASRLGIPVCMISKEEWKEEAPAFWKTQLQEDAPDLIVLAGFLWKIPSYLIQIFPDKIINLHPALLPKFGGKGMYGMHVHEAVLNQKETRTGITIHWVNEEYDEGAILFQAEIPVNLSESPEQLASRIHELEHTHFPNVILHTLAYENL